MVERFRMPPPLKLKSYILSLLLLVNLSIASSFSQSPPATLKFDFYGGEVELTYSPSFFVDFKEGLNNESIHSFYEKINTGAFHGIVMELLAYKSSHKLDDWLYYQLIRKTAQEISPKANNYHRYTLYKWFLLSGSGYDATLSIAGDQLLFYVQSNENIYNIPFRVREGKQYVCLNYHDYGLIDFDKVHFTEVCIPFAGANRSFSYRVNNLPEFKSGDYEEKDIRFNYNQQEYHFKVRLNNQIKTIFANYPVVDYESYFNIPLSRETYSSLIPLLKKSVKGMNQKNGVDYLMRFTRDGFLFEKDEANFGREKRLSPEQTLLYEYSDCEDRAALFFFLVKEIYNLPMLVLSFPEHVTIAVKFDKPVGNPIIYEGQSYSVCEPTPQKRDLAIGQLMPGLSRSPYEVAYVYTPSK